MKRILLLSVVFISFIFTAKSQSVFQMGVKAGGLSTWLMNSKIMSSNSDTTYRASFGYSVSLNASYFYNKRTYYSHNLKGVTLELGYSGLSQSYNTLTSQPSHKYNLGYVDLGLMFSVQPISDNGGYLLLGPQMSFLVNATATANKIVDANDNIIRNGTPKTNVKNNLSSSNMQAVLEFGKYFNSGRSSKFSYQVGARFSYGFSDITSPQAGTPSYSRSNLAYAGIVLGIQFKGVNYYN